MKPGGRDNVLIKEGTNIRKGKNMSDEEGRAREGAHKKQRGDNEIISESNLRPIGWKRAMMECIPAEKGVREGGLVLST